MKVLLNKVNNTKSSIIIYNHSGSCAIRQSGSKHKCFASIYSFFKKLLFSISSFGLNPEKMTLFIYIKLNKKEWCAFLQILSALVTYIRKCFASIHENTKKKLNRHLSFSFDLILIDKLFIGIFNKRVALTIYPKPFIKIKIIWWCHLQITCTIK